MNIVIVTFDGKKMEYAFKNDIKFVGVGDKVVVDTRFGLSIATVVDIKETHALANKFVVQKIDIEAHKTRLAKEEKMLTLKTKMEERRKKLQEIEIYQILAKEDSEMAKLLAEYSEMK